ncbi:MULTISPECIES: hypothetical protein [Methanothermobacter]|jgi:hypothetical protein|uniref:CopG family transcriptional regulator n=2 Tax=Methanothermobacter TaxID=145260 RepID=O26567_METTH|nr:MULTISPECIES: hypothetical protein [Methanothermobacter]MBC7112084.1 hypothetical protein [Methanothermobacter sp.]AAB84973.1 unknown [Methanothermobacter thermautotrophicus str. Delta H]MDI6817792.1 hypothetical protein [Methanothermobacter thermautotrophicus]MDN5374890.1 hypothetical protein [Methanothermobacter sp.]REE28869.1 hypothetical protein C7452_0894 [Methanothermobacter defluvii]
MVGRRPGGGLKDTKPVVVRLYPDEIEALKSRVPANTSMSAYIRRIILNHLEDD